MDPRKEYPITSENDVDVPTYSEENNLQIKIVRCSLSYINRNRKPIFYFVVFCLSVALLGVLIYFFIFSSNTLEPDFYTVWLAGRAFIIERSNPYSTNVTILSQLGITSALSQPGEDQLAFAYPVHSLWLILPTIWLNFPLAASLWISLNILGMYTAIYLLNRNIPKVMLLSLGGNYVIFFTLAVGNFSLIICILYLLIYALVVEKKSLSISGQFLCGILLIFLTIKPQITLPIIFIILIYSYKTRYYSVFIGFVIGLLVFIVPTLILFPRWPIEWIKRIVEYSGYMAGRLCVVYEYVSWISHGEISKWVGYLFIGLFLSITAIFGILWWRKMVSTLLFLTWIVFITLIFYPLQTTNGQMFLIIPLFILSVKSSNKIKQIIWYGIIIIFWMVFFLDYIGWSSGAIDTIPFIFYAGWIGYMFIDEWRRNQTHVSPLMPDLRYTTKIP